MLRSRKYRSRKTKAANRKQLETISNANSARIAVTRIRAFATRGYAGKKTMLVSWVRLYKSYPSVAMRRYHSPSQDAMRLTIPCLTDAGSNARLGTYASPYATPIRITAAEVIKAAMA